MDRGRGKRIKFPKKKTISGSSSEASDATLTPPPSLNVSREAENDILPEIINLCGKEKNLHTDTLDASHPPLPEPRSDENDYVTIHTIESPPLNITELPVVMIKGNK